MIRVATSPPASAPAWHAGFLALLPGILQYARLAFRHLPAEAREDAVEEVVAYALVAYVRLVERGKADLAYPTVLAGYGIARFRDGRRVAGYSARDVMSRYAQRKQGIVVERLDRRDRETGQWREAVLEDQRTPPPDQAAFRIDFPRWLATHSKRDRRIAEALAVGHGTGEVARRFGVTPSRISGLRQSFSRSWTAFHGEELPRSQAACAAVPR